jgi:hypothetical protein
MLFNNPNQMRFERAGRATSFDPPLKPDHYVKKCIFSAPGFLYQHCYPGPTERADEEGTEQSE